MDLSATEALKRESYSSVLLRVRVCTLQQDITISTYATHQVCVKEVQDVEVVTLFEYEVKELLE